MLAVGDLEFQKKCLGRMDAVAREGRTVLFVSHNIAAVEKLCQRAIVLVDGSIHADAAVQEGIAVYLDLIKGDSSAHVDVTQIKRRKGMEPALVSVQLLDQNDRPISYILAGQPIRFVLEYEQRRRVISPSFEIVFLDRYDEPILHLGTRYQMGEIQSIPATVIICPM